MKTHQPKSDPFDFDLQEQIEDSSRKPVPNSKPKSRVPQQQLFDFDEQPSDRKKSSSKLPMINQPSSSKLPATNKPAGKKQPTKLESVNKKDITYDFLQEQDGIEDFNGYAAKRPTYQPEQYEQPIQKQHKVTEEAAPKSKQLESKENYNEEQNYEDEYGEDFEEFADDHPSPKKAHKTQLKEDNRINNAEILKNKQPNLKPNIIKPQSLRKNPSRGSLRSNKSHRSVSKAKVNTDNQTALGFDPKKYEKEVQTNFPQVELQPLSIDNLNKLNDRMRAMIRRLNDQLNDILTKNTLLLKAKKQSKGQTKSVEDRLRIYEQEKRINQKMLEQSEEEVKRLRYKQGRIKDEDYEVDMHKRIGQFQQNKKQLEKEIHRLKVNVSSQGRRLTSGQKKKQNQNMNIFKNELVHQKKQELRLTDVIANVQKKIEQLLGKCEQTDSRLRDVSKQAANCGIDLTPKTDLKSKYDQLVRKKQSQARNGAMTQGLMKNKIAKCQGQITQTRKTIQNIDTNIKTTYNQIDGVLEQCRNAINRAKNSQRLPKPMEMSLDTILLSLAPQGPIQFDKVSHHSAKSQKLRTLSADKKKQVAEDDFLPLNPKKIAKNVQEDKPAIPSQKPNFRKKQPIQQKNVERIWKQQQKSGKPDLRLQKSVPVPSSSALDSRPPPVEQAKADSLKPMFMLKKRNNPNPPSQPQQAVAKQPLKPDLNSLRNIVQSKSNMIESVPQPPKQNEEDQPFGKRMMRLRRNQPKQQTEKEKPVFNQLKPANPPIINEPPKNDGRGKFDLEPQPKLTENVPEDKPIIPRRMLMKKKQQDQGGYNPTFKAPQPAAQAAPQQKPQQSVPYPGFSKPALKLDSNLPVAETTPAQTKQYKPPVVQPVAVAPQQRQEKQPPVNQQFNNPYAPKDNGLSQAPVRQRQGRVKKIKIDAPKQKITNIYQAAQVPEINQFIQQVKSVEKPLNKPLAQPPKAHKHEQLDINALLGINKAATHDPQDDLILGREKKVQPKPTAPVKKNRQQDFFGQFDV